MSDAPAADAAAPAAPGTASAWELVQEAARLAREGKRQDAVRVLEHAATLHPGDPLPVWRLAQIDLASGRPTEARARLEPLLASGRRLPGGLHAFCVQVGVALKDPDWTQARLTSGLREAPGFGELHLLAGRRWMERKRAAQALPHFVAAVNLMPRHAAAGLALGRCLEALGDHARAERVLAAALDADPGNAQLHVNRANALQRLERLDESLESYRRYAEIAGTPGFLLANVGALLRRMGDTAAALAIYRTALALEPAAAGTLYNCSNLLKEMGEPHAGVAMLRRALVLEPENAQFHWNLSLALLALGEVGEGFAEYEWRWRYDGFPSRRRNFDKPMWDGRPFAGRTLLLHTEQGMGDVLQFLRYLPEIKARGGRIVLECHEPLMSLLAELPEVDAMIPRFATPPAFDVHLPLLSAPLVLGHTSMDQVPRRTPYLAIPTAAPAFPIPEALADRVKVGLVWGGNPDFSNDRARSARLDAFLPLLAVPGVQLFSLQKGAREADLADAPAEIVRLSDRIGDFCDTASAMAQLDLVISTCTSTAHLAGALGCPLWVALHHAPDWRWMGGHGDSPWYPTARLFRQHRAGDWAGVVDRMAAALRDMVAGRHR